MSRNYNDDTLFKIGRTQAAMAPLRWLGIPVPDQIVYQSASVFYIRGDLSKVGDGYPVTSWVWDVLSNVALSKLLSFLDDNLSAHVYVHTDVRSGEHLRPQFATFYATMWKPILSGQDGVPVARSPYATQTVQIRFVDLILVEGYL